MPQLVYQTSHGKIEGEFAPFYIFLVAPVRQTFANVTITLMEDMGNMDPVTGLFTGCLGRLQRNESDTVAPPIPFPLLVPGIGQGFPTLFAKTAMTTGYNSTPIGQSTDVMEAFDGFIPSLWWLTGFTTLVMALIVVAVNVNNSISQLMSLEMEIKTKNHSWLRVKKSVLRSVKNRGLLQSVKQAAKVTMGNVFEQADRNTTKGQIWSRARKIGLDKSFIVGGVDIQQNVPDIMNRRAVYLTASYITGPAIRNFCLITRSMDTFTDLNPWYKVDESAQEKLLSMPYAKTADPKVVKRFSRVEQALLEQSLLEFGYRKIKIPVSPQPSVRQMHDCTANVIIYPDLEFHAAVLPHFKGLFHLCARLVVLNAILLIFELVVHLSFK